MINTTAITAIEDAGIAILTLTEALEEKEFLNSRLTRAETQRQLNIMIEQIDILPKHTQDLFAEVDWGAWRLVSRRLDEKQNMDHEGLWFAIHSLVPATLTWLRVYRQNQPELFSIKAKDDDKPPMINVRAITTIEDAGIAILTLTEDLEKKEFFNSRLTRAETQRQLNIMIEQIGTLPRQAQDLFAEVDWGAWRLVSHRLDKNHNSDQEGLWFAIHSLVPATLTWLRVYRQNQPELFGDQPIDELEMTGT